mmetsp:Transcript_26989/g.62571  ORF Transcript_26989/g.62571 Transcript_26989/m.62571 type:complete len:233 (-) Transcript_26989:1289-1987(-)
MEELRPSVVIREVAHGLPICRHIINGLECKDGNEKENQQLQGGGDTVGQEVLNADENTTRNEHSVHNGRKTRLGKHDIGGSTGRISGALHSYTHISALQSRSVVHTISSHTNLEAQLSQALNNQVLVLGEHLGETIGSQTHVSVVTRQVVRLLLGLRVKEGKSISGLDIVTHTQHASGLSGNQQVVTSDHLHGHTISVGIFDSLLGIRARRIKEGKHTKELPLLLVVGFGNG